MSAKKKKMTAAELMKILNKDQEYQDKRKIHDLEMKEFEKYLEKDEQPIIQALGKVGINVCSVWDLVNTSDPYPEAIPILIEHLKKPYHLRTKAGIARSLAVKEAKNMALTTLLSEYEKSIPDERIEDPKQRGYKEGLATAISFLTEKTDINLILKLIQDAKHGSSRIFFVDNLFQYREDTKIIEIVNKLKKDKDLSKEIESKFKI